MSMSDFRGSHLFTGALCPARSITVVPFRWPFSLTGESPVATTWTTSLTEKTFDVSSAAKMATKINTVGHRGIRLNIQPGRAGFEWSIALPLR
jgi:hypothetical protein